ncbi:hypothetical protein D9757_005458 [Collybiopsis confluens]|uniref:Translin n=1 Tax=Collybiopsis confluens TaxID=2823264 RepID=A0A8H5HMB6_9AGAR|nr:hypothetical protein D9757_005458 [Collybiopsis confluens]
MWHVYDEFVSHLPNITVQAAESMDPHNLEVLNEILDRESELKEVDLLAAAHIAYIYAAYNSESGNNLGHFSAPALVKTARPVLLSYRETTSALAFLIPPNQFWRWRESYCNSLRQAVFAAALSEYLTTGTLISLGDASEILGMQEEWKDRVKLVVEDYLLGLISMVNELSRLAVNAVILGDFEEPLKISAFVKELFSGFSMLNLKNDSLRRRFDSLKYDVKKIEEVVYDVSLRKLVSNE